MSAGFGKARKNPKMANPEFGTKRKANPTAIYYTSGPKCRKCHICQSDLARF